MRATRKQVLGALLLALLLLVYLLVRYWKYLG